MELENGEVQREVITVNNAQKFWQIVLQIGKKFKMRPSEFKILAKSGTIDERIYNDDIGNYIIKNLQIEKLDEKRLLNENPRRIIGQDKVFCDKLI